MFCKHHLFIPKQYSDWLISIKVHQSLKKNISIVLFHQSWSKFLIKDFFDRCHYQISSKTLSKFSLTKKTLIVTTGLNVQISLIMSQQTQSDIFYTKMLQNALWCQITWSKCMYCNILEYCSQTLDIHGHRVLQLILFLCPRH
jgi:hypothetical protein